MHTWDDVKRAVARPHPVIGTPPPGRQRPAVVTGWVVAAALGAVAGCGTTPTAGPLATGTPSPTSTALATTTPILPGSTPTSAAPADDEATGQPSGDDQQGNGDADQTPGEIDAVGGFCRQIGIEGMGRILGVPVSGQAIAGVQGCRFVTTDDRSVEVTLIQTKYRPADGMAVARNEATSTVEGTPVNLDDVGLAAFVVTGTVFGGDQTQGAGAVHVGNALVTVALNQQSDLSASLVRRSVVAVLRGIADAG